MSKEIAYRLGAEGIIHPRSVAVIGASEDVGKFGGRVMHYLVKHKFEGRIVPVNPKRETVFGVPCKSHISKAGEAVDVALLALPAEYLVAALSECAEAGVGACIVMTTGFAEAGEEGAARQEELLEISRTTGMRIVGPNCMGLISPHSKMALTSSLVLEVDHLQAGSVGLISQSGALMVSMYNRADDAKIGFSACVSLGNQADLEISDFVEYLLYDDATKVICIYMEGLRDPTRFLALADEARRVGKPIMVVKTGRTEAGVESAKSHTASLAGSYDVFTAACRDHGIMLLDDPDGMIEAANLLAQCPTRSSDGVSVFSASGGGAGIGVDRASEADLRLAVLSDQTRDKLQEVLLVPQARNPIDLGGRTISDPFEGAQRAFDAMAGDPDTGIVWIILTTVPFYDRMTELLARAALASDKPCIFLVTPGSAADGPRRILRELGCIYFDRVDDCIRVLKAWDAYFHMLGREPNATALQPEESRSVVPLKGAPGELLSETVVKTLLESYGVRVTRQREAVNAEDAVSVAEEIGYPVVLKPVADGLVHKSDIGAVKLNLPDAAAVRNAFAEIEQAVGQHLSASAFQGCAVQEMWVPELELILGIKHDPLFGPVVVCGAGGILVDLFSNVAVAVAPISVDKARDLLLSLKIAPLFGEFRGRAPLDLDAAAQALSRLSDLAWDYRDRLTELDVNPLGVRLKGGGVCALDARALLQ